MSTDHFYFSIDPRVAEASINWAVEMAAMRVAKAELSPRQDLSARSVWSCSPRSERSRSTGARSIASDKSHSDRSTSPTSRRTGGARSSRGGGGSKRGGGAPPAEYETPAANLAAGAALDYRTCLSLSSLPLMEVAAAPIHLNDSAAAGYQLSVHEACDPQSRVLTALRPQTRLHVLATRQLDDGAICAQGQL